MQFKEGTHVYTADGKDVGAIERVVLDPQTDEISHIVVREGWLFTEDKVVPTRLIDRAVADRVQLRADVQNLDELPQFEEVYYVPPGEAADDAYPADYAPSLYWYPPVGAAWSGYYTGYYGYPLAPYVSHTERNIPEGTVGLREGARVVSADGKHVGHVERVFTNNELNRATHLLITEGWLFQAKRAIPVEWIRTVDEDEIELAVDAHTLEQVPEYQGEPA
ncbi:MAG: PRC-barrel domain-containing protein [Caldilineaceae bacterium]